MLSAFWVLPGNMDFSREARRHRAEITSDPARSVTRPRKAHKPRTPEDAPLVRRPERESLRGVRIDRVARAANWVAASPSQRRQARQQTREPAAPLSELPCADRHMGRAE